jgi:hypothetical protein
VRVGNTPNPVTGEKRWYVFARVMFQEDGGAKGIFGSISWSNPVIYLAMFSHSEDVQRRIAECMELIEAGFRSGAPFCDLSRIGDEAAWSENWKRVEWRQ